MKKPKRKAAKKVAKKKAKPMARKVAAKRSAAKKKPVAKKKAARKVKFQNPFIWHDLMTPDVAGAKAFYSAVVGWNFTPQPPAYNVANVGNAGVGGIMETPEHLKGMPPFWTGYIYTPDVDKACAAIKKAGGHIHREPWDIPNTLRMAVVADPTGAVFNIMQPLSREQRIYPKEGAAGTVGWNELHAGDLGKAWTFYSKIFGWSKGTTMNMGQNRGIYQVFQIAKKDHGGIMKKFDQMPRPVWLHYFSVNGIDAAAGRIKQNGGAITMGPHEVPGGNWVIMATDPQGGHFALLSRTK